MIGLVLFVVIAGLLMFWIAGVLIAAAIAIPVFVVLVTVGFIWRIAWQH